MNSAKLGLLAQQLAIEVTGQNIANVQTEGYTRQEVTFEASTPRTTSLGQLGTGVVISGIERAHDQFLFAQIMGEGDLTGSIKVKKDIFEQLEILFNESSGRSLNSALSSFFAALQDVSTNPNGLPERADLVSKAEQMTSIFNQIGDQLFQIQRNIDLTIEDEITKVNTLATEIAKLNQAIHANEPGKITANDLRDSRDILVKELSEKIDIQLMNESDGQISLTLKNGTALVLKDRSFALSTELNGNNDAFKDILIDTGGGNLQNITSVIQGGGLRGQLDMRDTEVESIIDKMNILAAGFIQEFNKIHRSGFGIDGSSGLDFFNLLDVTVKTNVNNTGTAAVSMTNASPTTVPVDEFEIEFTGANSFTLQNLTTGASSGTFTFTAGSTFNLKNGFAVTISGAAAAGDKFIFSVSENAASQIAVSSTITADTRKIAAGNSTNGDGGNAQELADLQDSLVFTSVTLSSGSGAFTFDEFFNAVVSTVGIGSFSAQATLKQQEGVLLQLNSRRESSSGVSIDEEMIKMIKFQQAFNASARMISVVDEMLDTVVRL
ncbi:hypothetical protein UR09_03365 [Candidatus Nitromaritima sp. SCGC AAA799-A02]|nr:hypothetical protein UZ36_06425 [Candidatus Nitromaritima sp. SCGC AAA799-C22]KMP11411.1 hypothetical protein UR09_03365 [Candidatus Nitromaritima sp. SCGC AAA799-A02]